MLKIINITTKVDVCSLVYDCFSNRMVEDHDVSLCCYFPAEISINPKIKYYKSDGHIFSFFKKMNSLLKGNYDIIHMHMPHVALFYLIITFFNPKYRNNITIATIHCSFSNLKFRDKFIYLFIFLYFKKIIACSKPSYDSFPKLYKLIGKNRFSFINNGANVNKIDLIAKTFLEKHELDVFKIVVVGRLIELKNPYTILDAIANIEASIKLKLIFIGDGPLKNDLIQRSKSLEIENRIEFTGKISRDNVYRSCLTADLFISASIREGLPIAPLEAMYCGCPVILSDIPPHKEISLGSDWIRFFQPHDTNRLTVHITELINLEKKTRKDIGFKNRELVKNNFTMDNMIHNYYKLYNEFKKTENTL